jgi:hypothetical protein
MLDKVLREIGDHAAGSEEMDVGPFLIWLKFEHSKAKAEQRQN